MNELLPWIAFTAFIILMLALDLGVFNRRSHVIKPKEAGTWVAVWITLAALFNVGVYVVLGTEKGMQFTTGYLLEEMLSVDNMFVFVLIMTAFRVPAEYQHKLLFYGILGALIMRGAMIAAGVWLFAHFQWVFYVFGIFLVYTAVRMASEKEPDIDPQHNPVVENFAKHFPVVHHYHGAKFFVKEEIDGKLRMAATPLFLALLSIELTDLVFALDSIPAIFGVTQDPFIVYTSNVFAILGLRSMYFLLSHALDRFHLLKYGVAAILAFVGVKMLTHDVVDIPMVWSLVFIILAMIASIGLSLIHRHKMPEDRTEP